MKRLILIVLCLMLIPLPVLEREEWGAERGQDITAELPVLLWKRKTQPVPDKQFRKGKLQLRVMEPVRMR